MRIFLGARLGVHRTHGGLLFQRRRIARVAGLPAAQSGGLRLLPRLRRLLSPERTAPAGPSPVSPRRQPCVELAHAIITPCRRALITRRNRPIECVWGSAWIKGGYAGIGCWQDPAAPWLGR